ncbi:MAG: tRNA dihydrouridine synthase DusB [Chlamydiae bacterium]|nr:tRNA dihydrouridine synthase DusB [Chlamydiota bacterium]
MHNVPTFSLGDLHLPSKVLCAPLAGCSDLPFRKMTASYKPGLVYCEMVKMDALVRNDPHTFHLLDYEASMHPIGAQLCGSKPKLAAQCGRILQDMGFDVIDLNCGCPVDKVTKDGSGSGLLKTPDRIGEILSEIISAVKIPVTVKIRAGWDFQSINAKEIAQIAEAAGAKAICIHGRTRSQGYKGPANWDYITECKQATKTIKVIANGDIQCAESALRAFTTTGCDAVLVARATMGRPWVVEDIHRALLGLDPIKRTYLDFKNAFLEHIEYILRYQNDRKALLDIRRVGCWYLRQMRGAKALREGINRSRQLSETLHLIHSFTWEEVEYIENPEKEEIFCGAHEC